MQVNWTAWSQCVTNAINWLIAGENSIVVRLGNLEQGQKTMSAAFDALQAAWTAYQTDVNTKVAALNKSVSDLTAQVAADSTDAASIATLTDTVKAAQAALAGAANPPAPAAKTS